MNETDSRDLDDRHISWILQNRIARILHRPELQNRNLLKPKEIEDRLQLTELNSPPNGLDLTEIQIGKRDVFLDLLDWYRDRVHFEMVF